MSSTTPALIVTGDVKERSMRKKDLLTMQFYCGLMSEHDCLGWFKVYKKGGMTKYPYAKLQDIIAVFTKQINRETDIHLYDDLGGFIMELDSAFDAGVAYYLKHFYACKYSSKTLNMYDKEYDRLCRLANRYDYCID